MRFEEFADCQTWWADRRENEHAWRVPIADLEENGFNLDLRNPAEIDDLEHLPPTELLESLIATESSLLDALQELRNDLMDSA